MYNKYLVPAGIPISQDRILEILSVFQTSDLPKLKKAKNYYDGKQKILEKLATDEGRPANIVCINYCKPIVDNYMGYIVGKPVAFISEDETINEILRYNDVASTSAEYLRQALIYGRSFLINYIDEESQQRLQVLDATCCIPVYDDTIEGKLRYVIRFYQSNAYGIDPVSITYKVEVYGENEVVYYDSVPGYSSITETSRMPHYYGQCPITVFSLNADETGIFQPVYTLQDAINTLVSGEVDNFQDFADAYLVLQGMSADEEDLKNMKKHKCILLDAEEHCTAQFLTKNVSDTQVKDILENLSGELYNICQCPNFTDNKVFGSATSGVALRYKLLNFENASADIETQMRKALQRVIELICAILDLTDIETWRDIEIVFTRNLPLETTDIVNLVAALRGIVSVETLLGQIPFIDDPKEEIKRLEAERKTELYAFDNTNNYNLNSYEELTGTAEADYTKQ